MNTQAIQEEKAMKPKIKFQRMLLPLLLMGSPLAVQGGECGDPCTITALLPRLQWIDTNSVDWQARLAEGSFGIGEIGGNEPFKIENGTAENLLFLDAAGRIGVNTNVPEFTVDVLGDNIRLESSTSAGKAIMMRTDGANVELQADLANLTISAKKFLPAIPGDIIMNPFLIPMEMFSSAQRSMMQISNCMWKVTSKLLFLDSLVAPQTTD